MNKFWYSIVLCSLLFLTAGCRGQNNLTGPEEPPPGGGGSEDTPKMYFEVREEAGGTRLVVLLFNSATVHPDGTRTSKGWVRAGVDVEIPEANWEQIEWFAPDESKLVGNFHLDTTWFNLGRSDLDWTTTNQNGIYRKGDAIEIKVPGTYSGVRLKIVS